MTNVETPKGCQDVALKAGAMFMVFLVAVIAAWQYIGWWAGVLVIVAAILVVRWTIRRAVKRLMLLPFIMKGQVLRGAKVEIHAIDKVSRPHGGFGDEGSRVRAQTVRTPQGALPPGQEVVDSRDDSEKFVHEPVVEAAGASVDATRVYWRIEMTIRPEAGVSQITRWEPAQMVMVPYPSKTDMRTVKKIEGIMPVRVEVMENAGWVADTPGAYEGPARVRYTFPVKITSEEKRWKLRYYFEAIGDIKLG